MMINIHLFLRRLNMKKLEELNFGFILTQNPCIKTSHRDAYCSAKKKKSYVLKKLMKSQALQTAMLVGEKENRSTAIIQWIIHFRTTHLSSNILQKITKRCAIKLIWNLHINGWNYLFLATAGSWFCSKCVRLLYFSVSVPSYGKNQRNFLANPIKWGL